MWVHLLEWCADVFGLTVRSRIGGLVAGSLALLAMGVTFMMRWGWLGWVPPAILLGVAVATARQVSVAREHVWRAACLALDVPAQRPDQAALDGLQPPTAQALHALALAVDAARRGRYGAAHDLVPMIARECLRPEEAHLLDAVRAMISIGLGSPQRAAQQAVVALPTGSEELDMLLGRTVVSEAWAQPARLLAIRVAWARAGVSQDERAPLARLQRLVELRIDPAQMEQVKAQDARYLADEARAVGDDELASELDARSKTAYR